MYNRGDAKKFADSRITNSSFMLGAGRRRARWRVRR